MLIIPPPVPFIVAFEVLVSGVVFPERVPVNVTLGRVTQDGVCVASTIYSMYHLPLAVSRRSTGNRFAVVMVYPLRLFGQLTVEAVLVKLMFER